VQEPDNTTPPGGVDTFPPDGIAGTEEPTTGRGTTFKPVQGGESTSGEVLLIEAYAAMWLVVFVLIVLSWSRQKGIERRIASLREAIDKARREMDEISDDGGES